MIQVNAQHGQHSIHLIVCGISSMPLNEAKLLNLYSTKCSTQAYIAPIDLLAGEYYYSTK